MSAGGVGLVAPGLHAYPALQFTHTVAPAREYLPAAQAVALGELLPAAHKYPALHRPSQVALVDPRVLPKRPAGQRRHDDAPAVAEYRPAGQAVALAAAAPPTQK